MSAVSGDAPGFQPRRLIFWDFPRASWQYDIVVALILLFIFATPRPWFRDQPRASGIVLMSSAHGEYRYFIASELLTALEPSTREARAETLIRERTGKHTRIKRLEPIKDEAEREIRGFLAYTAP